MTTICTTKTRTNRAICSFQQENHSKTFEGCNHSLSFDDPWIKVYLWNARALEKIGETLQGGKCFEMGIIKTNDVETKQGKFLLNELKTMFPKDYEISMMPISTRKLNVLMKLT